MRHALIFAAGLGERMRPLTDRTPKPLLMAGGKPLIAWHLEKLAAVGVHYVVINTSHLADQFPEALGDGSRWGLRIRYAYEGPTPLETGGGMLNALPLLGPEPFIAVSADIYCDYDYAKLPLEPAGLAHLVMVPNPDWHAAGDFVLHDGQLQEQGAGERLTFGNIGVYRPQFVHGHAPGRFKLLPLYQQAMRDHQLSGERYDGFWRNLGTPAQLAELDAHLRG
ncbi:nucleotidyltransferase family protein [Dyella sp. LX-66]|uniref:N-acetylmuramate alpha-1-phosphate uridylyltransferase MurU n=1 Tax=unclassified Dyella TaxID=2634549 RepID=UPI001BE11DBA|nr:MULTISPECIES: nucleotidyltransferase family protein [unclassified Dyella]MBT2118733.1 nucleotidyltransferase family protein [Dyella sp. LX-1]MBT2141082.1 nucleotidyltransferase family protein [Dyella sp. LX-66]